MKTRFGSKILRGLCTFLCATLISACALIQKEKGSILLSTQSWGKKPLVWNNYYDGYIQVRVETDSSNQASVTQLAQIAALISAEYQPDCPYIQTVENKWQVSDDGLAREGILLIQCLDTGGGDSILRVLRQMVVNRSEVALLKASGLLWQPSSEEENALFKTRVIELNKPRFSSYPKELAARVQDQLIDFGYHKGDADGKWGSNSRSAMKTFQLDNGLIMSGELDSESLTLLGIQGPDETPKNSDDLPPFVDEKINRGTNVLINLVN